MTRIYTKRVESCRECPEADSYPWKCWAVDGGRRIINPFVIPDWCPLPKAND